MADQQPNMNEYRPPMHPANLPSSVAGKEILRYLCDGTIKVSKEMYLLLSIYLVGLSAWC